MPVRIIVFILSLLLFGVGAVAPWCDFAISPDHYFLKLHLDPKVPGSGLFAGLSLAMFALGAIWLLFTALKKPFISLLASSLILALVINYILAIGFVHTDVLLQLERERDNFVAIALLNESSFTSSGGEPTLWKNPDIHGTGWIARFIYTLEYTDTGWGAFAMGALLFWALTLSNFKSRGGKLIGLSSTLCIITAFALVATLPFLHSRSMLQQSQKMVGESNYSEAAKLMREAMRLDPWIRTQGEFQLVLSGLSSFDVEQADSELKILESKNLPKSSTVEEFISAYLAVENNSAQKDYAEALLTDQIFTRVIELYRSSQYSEARLVIEKAVPYLPNHIALRYAQVRTNYECKNYQGMIALASELIENFDHPVIRAALYNDIGDAYIQLGEPAKARENYWNSLDYFSKGNIRAIRMLSGV